MLRIFLLSAVVCAVAVCAGCKEEGDLFIVASDTDAPTTTAMPPGWTYTSAQRVVLFADEAATIYFTTDGSDPTTSSAVYSAPIDITETTTLKFFAEDEAGNAEAINTEVYMLIGWTTSQNISNTDPDWSFFCSVAVDASGIARVAWEEDVGGSNREIFYASSSDWPASKVNITNTATQGYNPSIAVGAGNVAYIAWNENVGATNEEIYLANSTNWTGTRANISNSSDYSFDPVIAIDGGNVIHMVWNENVGGTNGEIIYANSASWAATQNISNTATDSMEAALAIDGSGNLHVAWRENLPGGYDIYYANSTNWAGTKTNVSNSSDNSWDPSIAVDSNGTAHIVWREVLGGGASHEIYYAKSTDWAATLRNVSATADISFYPEIAVDVNNVVHLVWAENVGGTNMEIFYTNSIDWIGNQVNISNSSENCDYPDITIGPDHIIHLVWRERVGTPYEIFYCNSGG